MPERVVMEFLSITKILQLRLSEILHANTSSEVISGWSQL